ncbi:lysine/histidine transporter 8-like protein, partial [Trifolium pratense]
MSFPKSPFGSRFMNTPLASPMKKAIENIFEEVGHFTKFDPQDDWLPITACRKGNAYYAAFHLLCSGIGFQALVLPLAFTILGCYTPYGYSFSFTNRTQVFVIADTSNLLWQHL